MFFCAFIVFFSFIFYPLSIYNYLFIYLGGQTQTNSNKSNKSWYEILLFTANLELQEFSALVHQFDL